jgi:GNAT superfamily N-acetyltransferase
MFWHQTGAEFERNKYEPNRLAFKRQVETAERPPGVLAYRDGEPVGWCAVAPRAEYERLARARTLKPVDDEPVWSVVCFYVTRSQRRSGVTASLLAAAEEFAREHGAGMLEAYPADPEPGPWADPNAYTGRTVTYERAGFEAIERPGQRRVMRKRLG